MALTKDQQDEVDAQAKTEGVTSAALIDSQNTAYANTLMLQKCQAWWDDLSLDEKVAVHKRENP